MGYRPSRACIMGVPLLVERPFRVRNLIGAGTEPVHNGVGNPVPSFDVDRGKCDDRVSRIDQRAYAVFHLRRVRGNHQALTGASSSNKTPSAFVAAGKSVSVHILRMSRKYPSHGTTADNGYMICASLIRPQVNSPKTVDLVLFHQPFGAAMNPSSTRMVRG